jgi:hypothetical protein
MRTEPLEPPEGLSKIRSFVHIAVMTETIKAELDRALVRRFKKRAMERYGYQKGAVKKALEEAVRRYVASGKVDWEPLRGTLKSNIGPVELQHAAWNEVD